MPCIPTLIPRIPTLIPRSPTLIPRIPTLIPSIPTLIPCIPIIPLFPFPDSPFRLLQIVYRYYMMTSHRRLIISSYPKVIPSFP